MLLVPSTSQFWMLTGRPLKEMAASQHAHMRGIESAAERGRARNQRGQIGEIPGVQVELADLRAGNYVRNRSRFRCPRARRSH